MTEGEDSIIIEKTDEKPTPLLSKKKKSYTVDFKLEVVEFSRNFSPSEAGKRFNVDRRRIRDWTHQEDKLKELRSVTLLII